MVNVSWKAVIIMAWVTVLLFIVTAIVLAFTVKTKEDHEEPLDNEERKGGVTTFDDYAEAQRQLEDSLTRRQPDILIPPGASQTYIDMLRYQLEMEQKNEDEPLYPTHVLFVADPSTPYLTYWPQVHDIWQKVGNVQPILLLVAEQIPPQIPYRQHVVRFPPMSNIPSSFVVDMLHILYPALMMNSTVCVAALNMVLMKHAFIEENLRVCDESNFVALLPSTQEDYHPSLLNVAHQHVWADLFQVRNLLDVGQKIRMWFDEAKEEDSVLEASSRLCSAIRTWENENMFYYSAPGHHFEPMGCNGVCTISQNQWNKYSHAYLPFPSDCPGQTQELLQTLLRTS